MKKHVRLSIQKAIIEDIFHLLKKGVIQIIYLNTTKKMSCQEKRLHNSLLKHGNKIFDGLPQLLIQSVQCPK